MMDSLVLILPKAFTLASEVQDLYGSRVPTATEMRVISLVADGKNNNEVARAMGTPVHAVKNMLRMIFDKIGVWNRTELALWYVSRFGSGLWAEERGQDIAEYAIMLAVVLVMVVATVRLVGG
jgi:DNA-binding CsgD family transcriptional regulator